MVLGFLLVACKKLRAFLGTSYIIFHLATVQVADHVDVPSIETQSIPEGFAATMKKLEKVFSWFVYVEETYPLPLLEPTPLMIEAPRGRILKGIVSPSRLPTPTLGRPEKK